MSDTITLKSLFELSGYKFTEFLQDKQYPWEVVASLDDILKSLFDRDSDLVHENAIVGEGTVIDSSARIQDNVVIGSNCRIADGVLIREGCIIGDNVHIGHAVEIKHSIVLNNSAIAHLNYIGNSMIGNNVNFGGGAIAANWRFDKQSIVIRDADNRIDTKMEKFGSAIGDGSSIGVNAVLNPGTILGKESIVFPLTSVRGVHGAGSSVES